jgi:hypothetical protein
VIRSVTVAWIAAAPERKDDGELEESQRDQDHRGVGH